MRQLLAFILSCSMAIAVSFLQPLWAQDLSPRAYVITPLHSNAISRGYSFFTAVFSLKVRPGATGTYSVPSLSYYHSFSFLGRSANMNVTLPGSAGLPA
jgi:hypothetical protein